ncbi:hypothetical protein BC826DRAFT_239910 [Russula brevipes]|nr:hypothetical protein BC826DRAFT_239910 [Russula brevipes]
MSLDRNHLLQVLGATYEERGISLLPCYAVSLSVCGQPSCYEQTGVKSHWLLHDHRYFPVQQPPPRLSEIVSPRAWAAWSELHPVFYKAPVTAELSNAITGTTAQP